MTSPLCKVQWTITGTGKPELSSHTVYIMSELVLMGAEDSINNLYQMDNKRLLRQRTAGKPVHLMASEGQHGACSY